VRTHGGKSPQIKPIKLKTNRNKSRGLGFEISHEEDGMVEEVYAEIDGVSKLG
jgi:hypothetical protein